MGCLVCFQDRLCVVNPVCLVLHLLGRGHGDWLLGVLRLVRLNLERQLTLLLSLCLSIAPGWYQLRCMVNAADLRPQIVLLTAEVEWIGHDFTLKVTREADFDLAGSLQVLRLEVWQGRPGSLRLVRNEVSVLVHAGTARFATFWSLILRQVLRLEDLTDVIVLLGAGDFAPEAKRTSFRLR